MKKKKLLRKNEEKKINEESEAKITGGLESPFDITGNDKKIPGHNEEIWGSFGSVNETIMK